MRALCKTYKLWFFELWFFLFTGRPQSTFSQRESRKRQAKLPRVRCSSPNISSHKSDDIVDYPYQQTATIYAQGSHRNLVLVNGRIRTNQTQDEVEDKLLNYSVQVG